jgi:asparagine synthetase B (glutamine-hydrolysing)
MRRMVAAAPHRGTLQLAPVLFPNLTVGIQARSNEASLYQAEGLTVAAHGRVIAEPTSATCKANTTSAAVIAERWRTRGRAGLEGLDGEYSLCIVDAHASIVLVCVSLMMTRPLYVAQGDDVLVLAAEIRQCAIGAALERRLDLEQVALCLWIGAPVLDPSRTEYLGIDRILAPSIYRLRHADLALATDGVYWSPPEPLSEQESSSRLSAPKLALGALSRYVSELDGRIGQSLSAGHDSGTLWAVSRAARPRSGMPRKYAMTWPQDVMDEAPAIRAALNAAGEQGIFVDVSRKRTSDFLKEHIETLDRIPLAHTVHNATIIARRMAEDDIDMHLCGLGGEASLLVNPAFLADLARAGRWWRFALHLWRFHPYYVRGGRGARLRYLLRNAIAPSGSLIARIRQRARVNAVGVQWQPLYAAARRTLERDLACGGFSRGGCIVQVRYGSLLMGVETLDQTFERERIETVSPLLTQSLMNIPFETPPEELCRGRYDKQALRDVATLALGDDPGWGTTKLLPLAVESLDPRSLLDLGKPERWRLTELGFVSLVSARATLRALRHGQPLASIWYRVPYFERYLRTFGG